MSTTTNGTYFFSLIFTNSSSSTTTYLPNKAHLSFAGKCRPYLNARRSWSISCKATGKNNKNSNVEHTEKQEQPSSLFDKLDRRNVLIGLGGLYGATTLCPKPLASAAPLPPPDLTKCKPTEEGKLDCCPPVATVIKPFTPDLSIPVRTRPAAHQVTEEYLAKYKEAQARMRDLPENDPRSFVQQANVHCAYCEGAYPLPPPHSDVDIQVHYSWRFFPFHRMYLYFYEKILGKLIHDPTFAIPFWNWDSPHGFPIPSIYTDKHSPLYDQYRNINHKPPEPVDLGYCTKKKRPATTAENLAIMHRQMVWGAKTPDLFFGGQNTAEKQLNNKYAGTIERQPHNNIHNWVGDPNLGGEDMGQFYSAGRDPVFYAHHANVDRMWTIWKTLGGKRKDFTDSDWLDSEFLFYDENKELVSCKVRDSLEPEKNLRYTYEQVHIPWRFTKPTARKPKTKTIAQVMTEFPVTLDKIITVEVARPNPKKVGEEEVLVIKDIEFNISEAVCFDVHINDDAKSLSGKDKSEYAGSFVNVPMKGDRTVKAILKLGITDLLEDLGVKDESSVQVTLVPNAFDTPVTIGGLNIEYSS